MDRRLVAVGCAVVASVLVVGCSSSGSSPHQSTSFSDKGSPPGVAPSTASDSTSSSAPSSVDSSSGSSYNLAFTSADGWTYSASLPLPTASITAEKDISSSPPGFAKIKISLQSIPSVDAQDLSDTNPGRPNGPKLKLAPGTFVFPMEGNVVDQLDTSMLNQSGNASIGNPQIGPCELYAPYGGGGYWWPQEAGSIFCSPMSNSGESQYPASEKLVDQLITALHGIKLVYVVNYEENNSSSCNVAIYPSGRVQYAPDYASNCPSKISIKVTASH